MKRQSTKVKRQSKSQTPLAISSNQNPGQSQTTQKNIRSVCGLPKNLLSRIFIPLSVFELYKFCQTSKSCQGLCDNDGFWSLKLSHDFGTLTKPNDLSWKQQYMNFYESGNVYLYDVWNDDSVLVYDELIKHIDYDTPQFVISYQNDLFLIGNQKLASMPYSLRKYIKTIDCSGDDRCLIMTNVSDIKLYHHVLILRTNGDLLMIDTGGNLTNIESNVRTLVAEDDDNVWYITRANELKHGKVKENRVTLYCQIQDVTTASVYRSTVYYVKTDGSLWTYNTVLAQPDEFQNLPASQSHALLIPSLVRAVIAGPKSIAVINTGNQLWIYNHAKFNIGTEVMPVKLEGISDHINQSALLDNQYLTVAWANRGLFLITVDNKGYYMNTYLYKDVPHFVNDDVLHAYPQGVLNNFFYIKRSLKNRF